MSNDPAMHMKALGVTGVRAVRALRNLDMQSPAQYAPLHHKAGARPPSACDICSLPSYRLADIAVRRAAWQYRSGCNIFRVCTIHAGRAVRGAMSAL